MKSGASDPFGDESNEGDEGDEQVDQTDVAESVDRVDETESKQADAGESPVDAGESGAGGGGESSTSSGESTGTNDGESASNGSGAASNSSRSASNASGSTTGSDSGSADDEAEPLAGSGDQSLDRSQIPYTLRRDNVKDERPHVHQLFVRDDTDDAAREAERDLEEVLDTDVYRLDAREAIYRIGMRHPDEVAELLEDWGYNF
ncbi:hypothetical protein [Halobacterium zhouii]|uniref:hypothetical protein n=1 Tax=Halobacterium zhouii TaxID=2902624 RepID=UPI001E2B6548|nr:hypothetical protein [Halobacterium zhouii]